MSSVEECSPLASAVTSPPSPLLSPRPDSPQPRSPPEVECSSPVEPLHKDKTAAGEKPALPFQGAHNDDTGPDGDVTEAPLKPDSGGASAPDDVLHRLVALEKIPAARGKKKLNTIRINLAACKYSVLRVVAKKLGWVEVGDEAQWHVCWTDTSSGTDRLMRVRQPQKLNHFPGMLEIARKKSMARNLANMRTVYPEHYNFNPRTFLLPEMMEPFLAEVGKARKTPKTFIMKLDNGSQGRGIKLVQSTAEALAAIPTFEHENIVASQYVANPFLVNGYKFDMRIYVLVRCCDPLRVFIHEEGLARFCTNKYEPPSASNITNNYTHLTNYAVNKHNPNFIFNKDADSDSVGSKWSITALADWMRQQGHDWDAVWGSIKHMIAKSLIAIQPILQYYYRSATRADDEGFSCFEVLGYDVLLDETLRPWLVEVNHSPSFTTDTPLDLAIKTEVIYEAMQLVGVNVDSFREEEAVRDAAKLLRLYTTAANQQHQQQRCHTPTGVNCQSPALKPTPAPASPGMSKSTGALSQQPQTEPPQDAPNAVAAGSASAAETEETLHLEGPPPAIAERAGCSSWEAQQRAHEDANMGHYERIIPSDDPEKQALYEELQAAAQKVFYKQTMQGRLQQAILHMKERRQAEEAEAAAKEEAHKRRVESLKAWMATVYVKMRKQREQQAGQAATQRQLERSPAQLTHHQAQEGGLQGPQDSAESDGSSTALAEGCSPSARQCSTMHSPAFSEGGESAAADQEASGTGTYSYSSSRDSSPRAWGCGTGEPLSIDGVRPGAQLRRVTLTPNSSGIGSTGSWTPYSQALPEPTAGQLRYAWDNKPLQSQGGSPAAPRGKPSQAPASPIYSGRFMQRIATLHEAHGPGALERRASAPGQQPREARSIGSSRSYDGFQEDGDSASDYPEPDCSSGQELQSSKPSTYIPPAMLSALHSVNLAGHSPRQQLPLGVGSVGRSCGGTPPLSPAAALRGTAGQQLRQVTPPGRSPSRSRSLTPVAAYGRGFSSLQGSTGKSSIMQSRSPKRQPPALEQQVRRLVPVSPKAPSADSGRSASRRSSLAGSTASLQRAYMREIEKQAVNSIAQMIAEVLAGVAIVVIVVEELWQTLSYTTLVEDAVDTVTQWISGSDNVCYMTSSSVNLCVYSWVVVGASFLVSIILLVAQCFKDARCCAVMEGMLGAIALLWWIGAAVTCTIYGLQANDDHVPKQGWRTAVWALGWAEVGLFAFTLIFSFCGTAGGKLE
ncbi:hypothetical protein N2152v2_002480 [Parachlorella kessleri]